jgi:hypothetical protein
MGAGRDIFTEFYSHIFPFLLAGISYLYRSAYHVDAETFESGGAMRLLDLVNEVIEHAGEYGLTEDDVYASVAATAHIRALRTPDGSQIEFMGRKVFLFADLYKKVKQKTFEREIGVCRDEDYKKLREEKEDKRYYSEVRSAVERVVHEKLEAQMK